MITQQDDVEDDEEDGHTGSSNTSTSSGSDGDGGDDADDEDDGHTGSSDTPTNTSPMHDTPTVDVDGDDDDDADEYHLCSRQIGESVEVFWTTMGCWYKGKVVNTDINDGTIQVHYEDGYIRWHKRDVFEIRLVNPMHDTPISVNLWSWLIWITQEAREISVHQRIVFSSWCGLSRTVWIVSHKINTDCRV